MFINLNFCIMKPVTIQLEWREARELSDLLNRINSKHKRAIAKFEIAPEMVTIDEEVDVFKEESIALANTLDQLNEKLSTIE